MVRNEKALIIFHADSVVVVPRTRKKANQTECAPVQESATGRGVVCFFIQLICTFLLN